MDLFLQACGASGPLQLRLEGPGSTLGDCLTFDTPYVVIGRDRHADLVLDHRDVSDRHAYLQLIGGRLYCIDLGSKSGTSLGGQSRRAGWVEDQQAIRIGPYRIRLVAGDDGTVGNLELPPLTLDLLHRGFKASECLIDEGMSLLGSAVESQVRLLDPTVSSTHCSLLHTAMGLLVVDLLGKGGIQVNGVPVRHTMLLQGDELRVGSSSVRLRHALAPEFSRQWTESAWHDEPLRDAIASEVAPSSASASRSLSEAPASISVEEPDAETDWTATEHEQTWRSDAPAYEPTRKHAINEEVLTQLTGRERRNSCRYQVADVGAVLSWWEPKAIASVVLSATKSEPDVTDAESTMYSRMMGRWPGNHNGTTATRAAAESARVENLQATSDEGMISCTSDARLLDISQTGVMLLSETAPRINQRAWLRLETPQVTGWVEVVVKGASREAGGMHQLRLAFLESCPYDFFKIALYRKSGS